MTIESDSDSDEPVRKPSKSNLLPKIVLEKVKVPSSSEENTNSSDDEKPLKKKVPKPKPKSAKSKKTNITEKKTIVDSDSSDFMVIDDDSTDLMVDSKNKVTLIQFCSITWCFLLI